MRTAGVGREAGLLRRIQHRTVGLRRQPLQCAQILIGAVECERVERNAGQLRVLLRQLHLLANPIVERRLSTRPTGERLQLANASIGARRAREYRAQALRGEIVERALFARAIPEPNLVTHRILLQKYRARHDPAVVRIGLRDATAPVKRKVENRHYV